MDLVVGLFGLNVAQAFWEYWLQLSTFRFLECDFLDSLGIVLMEISFYIIGQFLISLSFITAEKALGLCTWIVGQF